MGSNHVEQTPRSVEDFRSFHVKCLLGGYCLWSVIVVEYRELGRMCCEDVFTYDVMKTGSAGCSLAVFTFML